MNERYEELLIESEQSPEARARLRAAMADDPELAEAVRQWETVRAALHDRLEANLPDCELLVLYALEEKGLAEHLSEAERERLADARNQLEAALASHPGLRDVVRDVQAACDEFEAQWAKHWSEPSASDEQRRPRSDRSPRPGLARQAERSWTRRLIAGTVLVVVAVAVLFLLPRGEETVTVETQTGEQRVVELADGSTVRLVDASRLSYAPVSGDDTFDRQVTLEEGRAFFEVAPASSPFVVETPTARATARGTMFGVQADPDMTEIVLASGNVSVAGRQGEEAVDLKPGQASRVHRNEAPSTPSAVTLSDALAWTGLFIFRDTPLHTIAERLSQQYDATVEIHPDLAEEEVTGTFEQSQDIEAILGVLATTLDAEVEISESGTYRLVPDRRS